MCGADFRIDGSKNQKIKEKEVFMLTALFLFFAYAFLGWVLETVFAFFRKGKAEKRGFLAGPVCPIYGYGGLFFHFLAFLLPYPFAFFFLAALFATALERVGGAFIAEKFGRRCWDYRKAPLHLSPDVSLFYSAVWGILALVTVKTVEPALLSLFARIPTGVLSVFLPVCLLLYAVDTGFSCFYAGRGENRTERR